jgi:hypothetical protein
MDIVQMEPNSWKERYARWGGKRGATIVLVTSNLRDESENSTE